MLAQSKFCWCLGLALAFMPLLAAQSCERWLVNQQAWAADRRDYQVVPAATQRQGGELAVTEFGRYARQVYTPQGFKDGAVLAAANRLVTLAGEYLDFYDVAYEHWAPLRGDDLRLRILPGTQSTFNKAVQKIEARYGLQVFYAPTVSFYQQKLVWVDETKKAIFLGPQNLIDQLRYLDFPLWHQLLKLEAAYQHAQGKFQRFWGSIAVHGHGVQRLFKELKTDNEYFVADWSDIYATWRELAVMAKNLARGRSVRAHQLTSSADEEIAIIQQKIDALKTYYSFIELTYKNMLAPFLKWHWSKMWHLRYWCQAWRAHNLNGLKYWPQQDVAAMQDVLASKIVLATEKDMLGNDRLWALLSFNHEGKRWTTIRIPLNEDALGPEFNYGQIERIPVVKTAVQQQAARQLIEQMQIFELLQSTLTFLNQPNVATDIYFNYHNARQTLAQLAAHVQTWNDMTKIEQILAEQQKRP